MKESKKIGILGAGTWGIALARLLDGNGHEVTVWSAVPREIEMLKKNHELPTLPGVRLPDSVRFTTDDREAVTGKDLLVMSVASPYTRQTARRFSTILTESVNMGPVIVSVAKGIDNDTLQTLSEVIACEIPTADVAVLCGPSHAEEVGKDLPTTIVAGAKTYETAEYIADIFMNDVFRVYTSPDMLGMQLGAALKNVIALAAGIADGLGYGDNTKAALITRGMAEITRLGTAMGARPETFAGLTGIGDLVVTCASMNSRNRRCGILIGQGRSLTEAQSEVGMVVEGVHCARAAMALAERFSVQLPIIEQVTAVLFDGKPAATAVRELMLRDRKSEIEEGWG